MADQDHDIVEVTYNGADKKISYKPESVVEILLDHAKRAFGAESQHRLSLFTEGGAELNDKETARKAGITPGMLLVLRQSTVKGGA